MKLYGFALSQPTRSVMLLLNAGKINYEFVVVNALKGDTRKPEFRKMNPAGLVPVLEHQNQIIGESGAIMTYIAETHQSSLQKWYPSNDPVQKAKINYWLHWHHSNSRLATRALLHNKLFPTSKLVQATYPSGLKTFEKALLQLESHFSTSSTSTPTPPLFLSGSSHPSIADLCLLTELDQLSPQAFSLLDLQASHPSVHQWMTRLTQGGEGGGLYLPGYEENFSAVKEVVKQMNSKQTV